MNTEEARLSFPVFYARGRSLENSGHTDDGVFEAYCRAFEVGQVGMEVIPERQLRFVANRAFTYATSDVVRSLHAPHTPSPEDLAKIKEQLERIKPAARYLGRLEVETLEGMLNDVAALETAPLVGKREPPKIEPAMPNPKRQDRYV